jgi:hypothetical protein
MIRAIQEALDSAGLALSDAGALAIGAGHRLDRALATWPTCSMRSRD